MEKRPCLIKRLPCLIGRFPFRRGATCLKARKSTFSGWPRAGLLAPHEAPDLPRLRSGLRRGAPHLQEDRGRPSRGVLAEVRRNFQQAAARVLVPSPVFDWEVCPCLIWKCLCPIGKRPYFDWRNFQPDAVGRILPARCRSRRSSRMPSLVSGASFHQV